MNKLSQEQADKLMEKLLFNINKSNVEEVFDIKE
jgi:hypothetical protein